MANPEHLDILKQGVKVWNAWRRENPDVRPDLQGADLKKADLAWVDLSRAMLDETDLDGAHLFRGNFALANLSSANLSEANLTYANLRKANILGSHLVGIKLEAADLEAANLEGSNMGGAHLERANLAGANLSGVYLGSAYFVSSKLAQANLKDCFLVDMTLAGVDLREARGLGTCTHHGPSFIDLRTIRKSWPLPRVFLRGCGLDEAFIDYLPSLLEDAVQFYSCFISYTSADEDFARRLHADLQDAGVRCWFAPEDLKIGDRFRYAIDEAIRVRDKLLLVLSEHSIESTWVETEVETALEEEAARSTTVLFPVRLDDAVLETKKPWAGHLRRTRHLGDFTGWQHHATYRPALDRLLRDLRA